MDGTSQHQSMSIVHITSKNTEVRKFQVLKRYETQISLDMTLDLGSQVKVYSKYGLKNVQGRRKIVQRLSISSFITIG